VGNGQTWTLAGSKLDEWSSAYPHLDVEAELRKARQWLIDNPPKRKTLRGMPRFLNGWLSRAQDSGRGVRRGNGTSSESAYKELKPLK
jgi:hypothetical protein